VIVVWLAVAVKVNHTSAAGPVVEPDGQVPKMGYGLTGVAPTLE
jgi:hypothetical protein